MGNLRLGPVEVIDNFAGDNGIDLAIVPGDAQITLELSQNENVIATLRFGPGPAQAFSKAWSRAIDNLENDQQHIMEPQQSNKPADD